VVKTVGSELLLLAMGSPKKGRKNEHERRPAR
jgi:hypothetical protein